MSKDDALTSFFKTFAATEDQLNFRMAHEMVGEKVPTISTGSYLLNEALSGGLAKGRLIQYYGPAGSGKTLMAMLAIKEAQKEDPTAKQCFIDAEGTFDPNWAETLGVDTSKIILIEGEMAVLGRNCFEMILGTPKEDKKTHHLVGKSKEGLIDQIVNKKININLIVLDSLGSIIPPGEDISAVGKMNMALLARFLTTTFKKLSLELNKAKVPFIIINHKKATLDAYGADHTFSGGNTYVHFLSANLYFETVNRSDAQILNEKDQKIGSTIRATVEKNKLGVWPRKCEFKVDFGIGIIDQHEEIAQLALDYNVVSKPTNVSHEYENQKWVGYGKYCDAIKNSPDLAKELLSKVEEAREAKMEAKRQAQKEKISGEKKEITTTDELDIEDETETNSTDESAPKKRGRPSKAVA